MSNHIQEKPRSDFLFEVSWEVCNKVGGINTVLISKAAKLIEIYKDAYCLIGPYFASKASEFEEIMPKPEYREVFDKLKKERIICHYGKWLIKGEPYAILIDFPRDKEKIDRIKKELWDSFKIDSLRAGYDYDEPLIWGYCVGQLLQQLLQVIPKNKKIAAQFHEWLAGPALLYLKKNKIEIATIFTTHATVLGRTLANNGIDFYSILNKMDKQKEVYKYCIEAKHMVEKCSAQNANVFTTVSEITGIEAEHFLERKPDILLPNGLDMEKFPTFEEESIEHKKQREKIKEFLLYYFFPYYTFDIRDVLFYFIAGRYEFKDKGIDIFIKALGKLNQKLKEEKSKKTIVSFIWVPANVKKIREELLESKTYFNDIKDFMDDEINDIKHNIIYSIVSKNKIKDDTLFEEDIILELKKKVARLKMNGAPPLVTHYLHDENDIIFRSMKEVGLNNLEEDKVKVVFYPIYLSGADRLLDLSYYEAMQGSHLGIFPSFYEPWGYTPLEAAGLGVSSVTTDLAGFGRFIDQLEKSKDNPGIFVLKRLGKNDEDVVNKAAAIMHNFSQLPKYERIANKMEARRLASTCDWKFLINNYIMSHNLAIEKAYK